MPGLAPKSDFDGRSIAARREDALELVEQPGRQRDVAGRTRLLIVKMGVRTQVRTITGRCTVKVHCAHEVAGNQRLKAVVNRGKRDCRQISLYPGKNFLSRGMIALLEEHLSGRRDNSQWLFSLLTLALWFEDVESLS